MKDQLNESKSFTAQNIELKLHADLVVLISVVLIIIYKKIREGKAIKDQLWISVFGL